MKKYIVFLFVILLLISGCRTNQNQSTKTNSKIIHLNGTNFNDEIKEGLVLVDFWAEWCGPCKAIAPILEELSEEIPELKFTKLNVDENPEIARKYQIRSIPNLKIFKDGKIIKEIIGSQPKEVLKKNIMSAIKPQ